MQMLIVLFRVLGKKRLSVYHPLQSGPDGDDTLTIPLSLRCCSIVSFLAPSLWDSGMGAGREDGRSYAV
jgi:hypothetical protein